MKRYEAVFFDFDGTLVYAEPEPFEQFLTLCRQVSLTARIFSRLLSLLIAACTSWWKGVGSRE
jgi:beta-phosphoglucomutase-like phosphatase (HAD superfamily)